ncbi:hypothetical protein, partial [Pseudomonas sp. PB106]|uniref:hypothetical protein n=1 Tax=Pseudomonas sp. PB106 TaxID=2494699 RepID=UPI00131C6F9A
RSFDLEKQHQKIAAFGSSYIIEQKMTNLRNAIQGNACSHVHACYPQSLPQFPGASRNTQSHATQGFAAEIESFLLDPEVAYVREMAFCTIARPAQ